MTSPASPTSHVTSYWAEYVQTGSRQAFDQLIHQHVNFVYAAVLRQVRDPHLAQDVTQAVFLVLARRAKTVRGEAALAGWLFNTARYCAANALRVEQRRRRHERAAAALRSEVVMSSAPSESESEAAAMLPILDDAIADLSRSDRDVILLRYLQGREMPEVGQAIGVSESAARKRVSRAVERLRQAFARRGVAVASAMVGTTLTVASTQAAPVGTAGVVSAATAGAVSPAVATIANGFLRAVFMAKAKFAVAAVGIALMLGGAGAVIVLSRSKPTTPVAQAPVPATPASGAPGAIPEGKTFALTIVDKATGQPLGNTSVVVYQDNEKTNHRTDAAGTLAVTFHRKSDYFVASVARPGYSPVRLNWQNYDNNDPVPPTYKLAMEKGTSIGGFVRDKDGAAIAGASVFLIVDKESADTHERSDIWDAQVRTDAKGHWQYDLAPEKLKSVSVRLSHPGYVSDDFYDNTARDEDPEAYRKLDRLLVMHKGLAVAGRVTDEAGKPIAGAKIRQGDDRWGSDFPETKSNRNGEFQFAQAEPGSMTLTVEAGGFSPELKSISVGNDLGLVEFKLAKGHVIRGRVVDPKGQPVEGATAIADTWRKKRTLAWQQKTDDDGQFEWTDAPADAVTFHVIKMNYMANRSAELTAGDAVQTVMLRPPLVVRGSVVDEVTGQPVPSFKVVYGRRNRDDDSISWDRRTDRPFIGGTYELKSQEPFAEGFLRIEADNHAPAVSAGFKMDQGVDAPLQIDFKLKQVENVGAVVLEPGGKPAAGAKAALAVPNQSTRIVDGKLDPHASGELVVVSAGNDGVISFPPQDTPAMVVVVSNAGYATLPFADLQKSKAKEIKLTAWCSVSATFKIGSKPFAGEPVHAESTAAGQMQGIFVDFECSKTTDTAGHATFEKVPAGPGYVQDWRMRPNGIWGGQVQVRFTAKPGESITVQAGGIGRPVTGQAIMPAEFKGKYDWLKGGNGDLVQIAPEQDMNHPLALPYPADWAKQSFDARRAWWQSPELKKFRQDQIDKENQTANSNASYAVVFEGDGHFRINDVPAGSYRLNIQLGGAWNDPARYENQLTGDKRIEIGPIPNGQSDEPQDVGTVTVAKSAKAIAQDTTPTTAPSPEPGSPADVERLYQDAIFAGDAETALSYVDTAHPSAEVFVRMQAAINAARNRVLDAAIAANGEEGASILLAKIGISGKRSANRFFPRLAWEIRGDTAIPNGQNARYFAQTMVHLDGHWKINIGEYLAMSYSDQTTMNTQFAKYIKRYDALTAGIKEGKIKTPDEAARVIQAND